MSRTSGNKIPDRPNRSTKRLWIFDIRDPAWQWVGAIAAIVGLVVTVIIAVVSWNRQIPHHELVVRRLIDLPVFYVGENANEKVQMYYDSQPVSYAGLIAIQIENAGNREITPEQWEFPLSIQFEQDVIAAYAYVSDSKPAGLRPVMSVDNNTLTVEPLLLNPGDSFTLNAIQFIMSYDTERLLRLNFIPSQFRVIARIRGVDITVTSGGALYSLSSALRSSLTIGLFFLPVAFIGAWAFAQVWQLIFGVKPRAAVILFICLALIILEIGLLVWTSLEIERMFRNLLYVATDPGR
ncbi:MAG: hypothetical protein FJ014_17880 [Chloroflexi bacterium]|nr:hypothetical protein [Chloroflexota bacterium]